MSVPGGTVVHVDAADQETAIIKLRELLDEARIIAWGLHHGQDPFVAGYPPPDWLTSDESPTLAWVHVEGSDTPPRLPAVTTPAQAEPRALVDEIDWLSRNLAKARRERDEARLWAWGGEHGMFPFSTADPPRWLTASALPADPATIASP